MLQTLPNYGIAHVLYYIVNDYTKITQEMSKPDFGENVRGGGKIFRGGATMISSSRQRVKIKNTLLLKL